MPFPEAPVQFGVFDWIEWDERPISDIYEQRLKMLQYADEAGFFCYHLAEHGLTPHSLAPSSGLFLAAAAQRTSRIKLGSLVYNLPLYNPFRNFDTLKNSEVIIAGSPQTVREQVKRAIEETGCNYFCSIFSFCYNRSPISEKPISDCRGA